MKVKFYIITNKKLSTKVKKLKQEDFNGKPVEVMESETINMIIYLAVGIGIALVILAMLLTGHNLTV